MQCQYSTVVKLNFPMSVRVERRYNNSISVFRGYVHANIHTTAPKCGRIIVLNTIVQGCTALLLISEGNFLTANKHTGWYVFVLGLQNQQTHTITNMLYVVHADLFSMDSPWMRRSQC